MAENSGDVGSYYWMNYLGSGINEDTIRSMCCRLNIDMSQLSGPSGLWNTGEGTGSLGVITINFPRLGFDCKGKDEKVFFEKLEERLETALYILNFRKNRISKYLDRMMPFNILNGWSMRTYYLTIGVIGLNELCENYLGSDITKNIDFVVRVLEYLRDWSKKKQLETKQFINIEMIPGEGSSYRLAYVDRKLHPDIFTLGTKRAPYYSALLIPPYFGLDIFERLELEEKVLPLFTGGTIFRVFLGEKKPEPDTVLDLIKKISSSKIPYFDLTSTYSICKKESKTFRGIKYNCPDCNFPTEVFSRVVGYYRPLSKFNIGKVQEFKDRKYVSIN
jgi:ribonucleoside-triphosphate reductase